MIIDILTLFPEAINGAINTSILKRAMESNLLTINVIDYREYSNKKNKRVDDYSYGGGAGMIIEPQPIVDALRHIKGYENAHKIITSPVGRVFNQNIAKELSSLDHIIIVCGHYEGIDERIMNYVDEAISIGDYILTGGEIAALAICDSVSRLVPNVLGNDESAVEESFDDNLLEYPQYTRPESFEGYDVPKVLLSGNHEEIRKWRRFKSLERTYKNRPELLKEEELSKEDRTFLEDIKRGITR
ncbi:MAG: tRNA (guanosine(37)-N1)-methyltransferase TrmD [Bacilli bacterium]|nr:tRNA (guanosine(37)-N1)-methyltransferase TrmD [Bacilli bacterium]